MSSSQEEKDEILSDVQIFNVDKGQILVDVDSVDNACLILVLTGCVGVFQKSSDDESLKEIHKAYPGEKF